MPQKDKFDHICEICNGIGELTNDHRYILRIQKLFENYVLREKKEEKPVKPKFQRTFLEINEVFDIAITEVNRIDAVEIGKQFTHQFQIENIGQDLPEALELVDCEIMEPTPIETIRSGEKVVVNVGPFVCRDEEVLRKSFHLCYRAENGWVRIGHRFGFRIKGFKKRQIKNQAKKQEEKTLVLLRDLKMLSGSDKSEAYIGKELRKMGIDLAHIEM